MSLESVETVIGKAILDSEFRNQLFADPEQALAAFELTPAEKSRIRRLDSETLDVLVKILNLRLDRPGQNS